MTYRQTFWLLKVAEIVGAGIVYVALWWLGWLVRVQIFNDPERATLSNGTDFTWFWNPFAAILFILVPVMIVGLVCFTLYSWIEQNKRWARRYSERRMGRKH